MPDSPKPKRPAGASRGKGGLGGGPGSATPKAKPAGKARGIGRGLEAILAASPAPGGGNASAASELREIPVPLIEPNPDQPRRRFDPDELQALADSISTQGLLQPVLVRPRPGGRYEIVAGERRWRASQIAGQETIPAIVRERTNAETLEAALVENMARADLTPIEEARACAGLVEELGLSREEVAQRVGRSRSAVSNLIRLLDLPDEVIELLEDGELTRAMAAPCSSRPISPIVDGSPARPSRRPGACERSSGVLAPAAPANRSDPPPSPPRPSRPPITSPPPRTSPTSSPHRWASRCA